MLHRIVLPDFIVKLAHDNSATGRVDFRSIRNRFERIYIAARRSMQSPTVPPRKRHNCHRMIQMCGICGITHDESGERVRAMNSRMVHRGPDDEGVYVDPACAFAMGVRRLSVIDLSGGHQPIANEDESVWAVLNGEIYNFEALSDHLRRAGHALRSATDTEVLVHLYEDYGAELVHALDGMYGFAIWDARRRRLLLARDRFGEKPLFYCERPGHLVFASELSALRSGLDFAPDLDPGSLDAYLVLGYVPGAQTIFENIRALEPGSILEWSVDMPTPRVSRYWTMPTRPRRRAGSMKDYAEEASVLLRRAVRSRLIADVPVGVLLSGGLDSSLVARTVAEVGGLPLRTFTVSYDVGTVSEASEARDIARRLGAEHHEFKMSVSDVQARVPAVLAALDQPNADPALVALHAVSELARQTVTVVLGGEGADELFGGYPRYRWLARAERLAKVLPPVLGRLGARVTELSSNPKAARVSALLLPAHTVERQIEWVASGLRARRETLYGDRLKTAVHDDLAVSDAETVFARTGAGGPIGRLMQLDQARYLPDDVLAKGDRATMQLSLEMRSPFLSRELAEFSAGIPDEVHVRNGGKAVLRAVARDMPGMGRKSRAKTAFRVPLAEWLRGPLAPVVDQLSVDGRLVRDQWIDGGELRRLVTAHQSGDEDHGRVIWTVMAAELCL
jgi:asparagine synthase (glutamine-hydrolysing)